MPLDIKAEIAQRLDVDEDALEPILDTVVQRIRQQVAHYGYARLAGLGTFRGRDGALIFEPDAVLAETVNLRFAGLAPIRVEAPSAEAPEPVEPASPFSARWDEKDLPEAHTLSEFEEEDEAADAQAGPDERPDEAATEKEDWTAEAEAVEPDDAEEDVWLSHREEEEHPLGPVPTLAYEDADFSLVDDHEEDVGPLPELSFEDDEADDGAVEPAAPEEDESSIAAAATWAALGASVTEEEGPRADEAAEDTADDTAGTEVEMAEAEAEIAEPEAEKAEAEGNEAAPAGRTHGPDRDARAHDRMRRDWPSERTTSDLGRESSRRNTILIGAGIIVLVAAAAIAYFALQPVAPTGPDTAQTEAQQPVQEEMPEAQAGDAQDAPQEPAEGGAVEEPAPTEPAAESTPLRSPEGIDATAGGFSIVVFSETSEGSASDVAQQYRAEGFRSDVLPSEEGGVTRYRVGIGQFETLEEAVDARNQLAGNELPQDAWVYKME